MKEVVNNMKKEIRKRILELRSSLSQEELLSKSKAIAEKVFTMPEYRQAQTVMVYIAFRNEVDTEEIITHALANGKRVIIPVVDVGTNLIPSELKRYPEDLAPGTWGILEPKLECFRPINPQEIDLVLVPGVGFDLSGNRLGYGAGYYDLFLPQLNGRATAAALAFSLQLVDKIPASGNDYPMDYIITEEMVCRCRTGS